MRRRRPEVGRPRCERVATRRREVAALRVGVVVEEHRDRERRRPTTRRTHARVAAAARSASSPLERDERHDVERAEARVHAGVSGDRDAAGDGGCRAPRPRRRRRPRAGPASVNTERWWSASACTSSSDGAARGRRVPERRIDRVPRTRSGRTRARRRGVRSSVASPPMKFGLALPQYDYSVAGERPAAFETIVEYARGGRARRVRLGVAVGPPVPRPREVRRPPDRAVASSRSSRSPRSRGVVRRPRSARSCCARRCGPRRCSPRRSRRSTASAAAGSTSGSARVGTSPSTTRSAWRCRRPGVRLARLREARRRRQRPARRWAVHVRRPLPPRRRRGEPAPGACSSRARACSSAARATGCSDSSPSTPTGGTRAGRGRPTRTASGSRCSTRACEAVEPRSRDGLAVARALRARAARTSAISARRFERLRAIVPPGVLDGVDLDELRERPARRHRRAGAGAGRRAGRPRRRDADRAASGAVPFQVSALDDVELLAAALRALTVGRRTAVPCACDPSKGSRHVRSELPNSSSSWLIVLLLFGGTQLPKLAVSLGQAQKEFKRASTRATSRRRRQPERRRQERANTAPSRTAPARELRDRARSLLSMADGVPTWEEVARDSRALPLQRGLPPGRQRRRRTGSRAGGAAPGPRGPGDATSPAPWRAGWPGS